MFERFLNTQRISPPDIDIDFADVVRDKVIDYLVKKYGHDSVGKVATFSTLKARAAITDVGRVLEIPIENVRKLTRLAPSLPELTSEEMIKVAPNFRNWAELPEYQDLINISQRDCGYEKTYLYSCVRSRSLRMEVSPIMFHFSEIITVKLQHSLMVKLWKMWAL